MVRAVVGVVLFVLSHLAVAAVVEREVTYSFDGVEMKGFHAYDNAIRGERPGVLVVHEWWGHNNYARKRARMLAKMGYSALAIDMYGNGTQANHPDDAAKFAKAVRGNMALMRARFLAAMEALSRERVTDEERIAAIGYCFGGGVVLEMARQGLDLAAVASFHGSLGTMEPAKPGTVKADILVANGASDPFVKPEQIADFSSEMASAGVSFTFVNYEGAKHSFTNPDADRFGKLFKLPLAYNAQADKASWGVLERFLFTALSR